VPSGEYIKTYYEQANCHLHVCIVIAMVSVLHGYSRQRRTIGSFSATAGLLVKTIFITAALQQRKTRSVAVAKEGGS